MANISKLSILIPVYNEELLIGDLLLKVYEVNLVGNIEKEVIVVNDDSNDKTENIIQQFITDYPLLNLIYLAHNKNKGKGAALHTAINAASGDYLIIQDADLEYNPHDYNHLLAPILNEDVTVVYGSRFIETDKSPQKITIHSLANYFLTYLSNFFTYFILTDMETCYKLIPTAIMRSLDLKEKRFGFEPEITAKLGKMKRLKIKEIAISYQRRSLHEGKKIGWKDGFRAIYCIFKYNLFS